MISIIIPFYNEEKNLPVLMSKLFKILKSSKDNFEVILVDDGSTDDSSSKLKIKGQKLKIIKHRRKLGKGEALKTGIENSKGEIIIFMDADLQDDPKDIPKFIKKIKEGYDFVNGFRINRQESFVLRIYSKLASFFLKTFMNSPYTDINCGFKAFKKEVLKDFIFYGNNFRFFPLYVFYQGYKVTEVSVINHPRIFGSSKFGKKKLFIGVLDMITAFFLYKFSEKPLHFFGIIGLVFSFSGFVILFYLTYERIFHQMLLYRRPILFLGILLVLVGIQIAMTGIIGELMVYLNKKNNLKS